MKKTSIKPARCLLLAALLTLTLASLLMQGAPARRAPTPGGPAGVGAASAHAVAGAGTRGVAPGASREYFGGRQRRVSDEITKLIPVAGGRDSGRTEDAEGEHKTDQPDQAGRWRLLRMVSENGDIPHRALVQAWEQRKRIAVDPRAWGRAVQSQSSGAKVGPLVAGIQSAGWTWLGPGNVGGRLRSVIVHPTDPQTIWVGSVGGGIWKTADGGASWGALNDFMTSLAVGCMAIDPTNPNVLYVGTGEGVFNGDAIRGAGVFKTTDGGATWAQLSSTNNPSWYYVNRIAVSPDNSQTLLAATNTGIWRSADGGATWTLRSLTGAFDIDFHPTDGSKCVASGNPNARYSTDGGLSWTEATGLPSGRVEVAYARSNPSVVYASADHNDGELYMSSDGGHAFVLRNTGTNYFNGQGWYDNALWVDPTNPNTLMVGGIRVWRSTDGGATLTQVGSLHADQHAIVESPQFNGTSNKTVYFGNDGGIYRTTDVYAADPVMTELNNNLGVTQFYGGAGNATSGRIIGGTQDNGTLRYAGDTEAWSSAIGGDGGWCASDPTDPNFFYGEFQWMQVHRSTNGGLSSNAIYHNLPEAGTGTTNFIAPLVLDPNNPNTLLAGGQNLWRTTSAKMAAPPPWSSIKGSTGVPISAVAVAKGNSDIIWVGHNNGDVYFTTTGTSASPSWTRADLGSPALPNRYCTRITIDPTNPNRVYVAFGGFNPGNVWRTDNGTTWANVTANLPSAPVYSLVVWQQNPSHLYVGTEVGIFASADGGQTWSPSNDGPTNCSVDELFWMNDTLVAATHGRGMFSINVAAPSPTKTLTVASSNPSGGVSVTVSPADNNNAGSGVTQFSRTYDNDASVSLTAPPTAAGNAFQKWQRNGTDFSNAPTVNVTMDADYTLTAVYTAPPGASAVYDSVLKAPKCAELGGQCDSGTLLEGRDTMSGGPEPNQPNTINNSCADGQGGTYHSDESLDRLKVSTLDGSDFAPGKTVKIEATVWVYSTTQNFLDLFYAPDAANPSWTEIGTVSPTAGGPQTLSLTYVLPNGGDLQAVRAAFRFGGTRMPCSVGGFNDHDDLVFRVPASGTRALTVASSNPSGGVNITVSPNDNGGLGSDLTPFTRNYNVNTLVTLTAPATTGTGVFQKWTRDGADLSTDTSVPVTMSSDRTLTAVYVNCSYLFSPVGQNFSAAGGAANFTIAAPAGCAWTAASNVPWISITSGGSGSGNGTVNYSVARNSDLAARSGTITFAGQTFNVSQSGAVPNDHFADAQVLGGASGGTTGSNVGATRENGEPAHAGHSSSGSVWYRWQAPSTGSASFRTTGSGFDTVLAVYTGTSVSGLTAITSNDDHPAGGVHSLVTFNATAGTVYHVAVAGFGTAAGDIILNWHPFIPNDNFTDARVLGGATGSTTGSNVGATRENGEPTHAGRGGGASVWYRWQAPSAGSMSFTTTGSDYDTVLAVYTGSSVSGLSTIASNDDNPAGGLQSFVSFGATAGTVYYVAVDGFGPATGNIVLNWGAGSCTLRIDTVSPAAGRAAGGQQITLSGAFNGLSAVTLDGINSPWSSGGANQITVWTPPHAVGAVSIGLGSASCETFLKSKAFAYLPTSFTDDPLVAGVTMAKGQHILELRQSVDALRAVAGLGPAPWSDASLTQFGTNIKAVHILELREFLNDAATRLGYATAPYTDPSLPAGSFIKRVHVEELRARIRAIAG